jgi:tetratricopeptide (TPR) repeat protein
MKSLRARTLADKARTLAADSESMLELQARILRVEGHFDEALAAYTALMRSSAHFRVDVAECLIELGRSAEAVPLLEEAIRPDRDMLARFSRYWALGVALVHIGRYEQAISWLIAANGRTLGGVLLRTNTLRGRCLPYITRRQIAARRRAEFRWRPVCRHYRGSRR